MTRSARRGLARNPSATAEVLRRLLRTHPDETCEGLRDRADLPRPVQEAMAAHPAPAVRRALARHPLVDPDLRARLLDDPDWRVRIRAFGHRDQRPLPDAVVTRVFTELPRWAPETRATADELLIEFLEANGYSWQPLLVAAAHPDPWVRRYAAGSAGRRDELRTLLSDPDPSVRETAAHAVAESARVMQPADLPAQHCHAFWMVLHRPLSPALVSQLLAGDDVEALSAIAASSSLSPQDVERLVRHPAPEVRQVTAVRRDLTGAQLRLLAADADISVRTAASVHPDLTEEERARVEIDPGPPGGGGSAPEHADALRWAGSVNPLLRRRAACRPDLPAELVAALAEDPDPGVRLNLARHHPAAPPALLLRCFLEYHGRDTLPELPGFPRAGLARFVGHPDPAVRALVALDPDADPGTVERLTTDPDAGVRRAMASCPRLPVARIEALLTDPDLAEDAAANPSLPPARMLELSEA
ncbi:hypothetical protein KZZ52_38070 [Dactylosporangium sp. AC04546]|uniref:hypothetical protein n=1 Tax=Dactylosporangium sp. AC04546 TaxID=2862460 RepID=UPI001EDDBC56|nr:hypothetical protein [Dactylosporangium sp. AC04546]WVK79769.1 hypothetical protein KZZ52_38070 [Dactylosporangium sp. AC04546]